MYLSEAWPHAVLMFTVVPGLISFSEIIHNLIELLFHPDESHIEKLREMSTQKENENV